MLNFRSVNFAYEPGKNVLTDVSFELPSGSCTLLAGRNGSGKSTIVQLCNGLLRPTSGDILLRGLSTRTRDDHDIVRDVAVMFQHPGDQITERTVAREVRVGLELLGLDRPDIRAIAALELVNLAHRAAAHPYDLEPSERKLVALAATLAMSTPIVVLDEPLVGLGPAETRIVERAVNQLRHDGRIVLFVVHDILQAWPLADRVIALRNGHVAMDQPTGDGSAPSFVLAAAGMPAPTTERFSAILRRTAH